MDLQKNKIYYFEDRDEVEVILAILNNEEYNWLFFEKGYGMFYLRKGSKEDFERNAYTYLYEVIPGKFVHDFFKTRANKIINRDKLDNYNELLEFLNKYETVYHYSKITNYLFEKFGISNPKNIEDLFKIQKFYNEELIKIKKKEILNYRELDCFDIRSCILDEIQEFKKELPYNFNFKTYRFKEFSPEKLKEEFVDILNFLLCKSLKNKTAEYLIDVWNAYNSRTVYAKLEMIIKNEMDLAIKHFEYWATEAEFELANHKKIETFTVSSYLELGAIFEITKEVIYDQYWKKFLFNCKRDLKME
ncbi:dUTP diphosphatase [Fusobacterium gastrosuis]|uniref:dUTP diphosphatase n=1 Tax=Fusobacterium gastrosuis TaxID=1755100 RepID=UPI00297BA169|nr:dUTP diphosphatase [Fusobacteriaceae bacterium]MDY5713676.1 dUTP diphosphatase [Fusobacterium gastrosuis]